MVQRVFISSTEELSSTEDLKDYRGKARDAVLRSDLLPVMMEYFGANGAAMPLEQCLAKVRQADVLVVLVAHRYGWVPPDQVGNEYKSITWLECQEAVDCHKEVLAFLIDNKHPWPDNLREESSVLALATGNAQVSEIIEKVQRAQRDYQGLIRFKKWLSDGGIRATFTTPEDLAFKVLQALADWKLRIGGKAKKFPSKGQDVDTKALALRYAYRSRLTELLCLYYKHVIHDDDVLVAPDGMPVLSQRHLIPEQPCPLSKLDNRLDLRKTPPHPSRLSRTTLGWCRFCKVGAQGRAYSTGYCLGFLVSTPSGDSNSAWVITLTS